MSIENTSLRSQRFVVSDAHTLVLFVCVCGLTMLLWWALVMRSMRPTRSVVDTPWVLLHSLQTSTLVRTGLNVHNTNSSIKASCVTGLPVPTRPFYFFICVFSIHSKSDVICEGRTKLKRIQMWTTV